MMQFLLDSTELTAEQLGELEALIKEKKKRSTARKTKGTKRSR